VWESAPCQGYNGAMEVAMMLQVIDSWDQDISQFETQFKKKNQCFTFSCVWLKKEK
jgi:hypothetical protein